MFCRIEKRNILRIGSGPSALDILNPERIELFSDSNLVLNAERYTLGLRAVSQGCIIDHDLLRIHISRTDSVSQHRGVCKSFVRVPPSGGGGGLFLVARVCRQKGGTLRKRNRGRVLA